MSDKKGRFEPGVSGNPNGRPKGFKSAMKELYKGREKEIAQKIFDKAMDGDSACLVFIANLAKDGRGSKNENG